MVILTSMLKFTTREKTEFMEEIQAATEGFVIPVYASNFDFTLALTIVAYTLFAQKAWLHGRSPPLWANPHRPPHQHLSRRCFVAPNSQHTTLLSSKFTPTTVATHTVETGV